MLCSGILILILFVDSTSKAVCCTFRGKKEGFSSRENQTQNCENKRSAPLDFRFASTSNNGNKLNNQRLQQVKHNATILRHFHQQSMFVSSHFCREKITMKLFTVLSSFRSFLYWRGQRLFFLEGWKGKCFPHTGKSTLGVSLSWFRYQLLSVRDMKVRCVEISVGKSDSRLIMKKNVKGFLSTNLTKSSDTQSIFYAFKKKTFSTWLRILATCPLFVSL